MTGTATISSDGRYRYELTRYWEPGPDACFIMLNPSTADADQDDPTIRRCVSFARREGCGSLTVVNLFAFRATDPRALKSQSINPVGPNNDRHIVEAAHRATGPIICAWGASSPYDWRAPDVLRLIRRPTYCLGITKDGSPRHPLYLPSAAPLLPYPQGEAP